MEVLLDQTSTVLLYISPTTSLFYEVLSVCDFTMHTPKGFFKSHQMSNADMLFFAFISIVTLGLVHLVVLLMPIQFVQINDFVGICSGTYILYRKI